MTILSKLKEMIGGGQENYSDGEYESENQDLGQSYPMQQDDSYGLSEQMTIRETIVQPSSQTTSRIFRKEQSVSTEVPSYPNLNSSSNNFPDNVIGMPGPNNMINEVVVIEPHSFEEIPQVIQTLKEQRSVVLNLNVMEPDEAQRAVDFVAGGTYAIDGHQERIGESIFLFTPRNVKVSNIPGKSYNNNSSETVITYNDLSNSFADDIWSGNNSHVENINMA